MNTRFLKFVLSAAMLTLLAAFLFTGTVHAQDTAPQPETLPTSAPEVVPVEVVPLPEEAVADAPIEIAATEPVLLAETLSDSGLIVVDTNGESVPLTVEALTDVDPWFKVGATTYAFTITDCNPDVAGNQGCLNPLQAAVDYISANGTIPSDGFIHVDAGTLPNQKVTIDGTQPFLNSLKGIAGHVNPDTFTPDAILSFTDGTTGSYLFVHNKLNGFILSGLSIKGDITPLFSQWGVVDIIDSKGAVLLQDLVVENGYYGGSGIRIYNHDGIITIKNVDSSRNGGGGAYISNLVSTAGVTITNSSFDDNNAGGASFPTTGLHIITKGAVSISGISASRNMGTDPNLWIEQASSVTIKSSEINENLTSTGLDIQGIKGAITLLNVYADQNNAGLTFSTEGNISLTNVSASQNTLYGARLDTCWGAPCITSGSGKVTIAASTFDSNTTSGGGVDISGLWVHARGAISLTGVSASINGTVGVDATGAILKNHDSQLVSPVTIKTSTFDHNQLKGLTVNSKGAINLTSVSASQNIGNTGALLDNTTGTTAGVTIKGSSIAPNKFNLNGNSAGEHGLEIRTNGSVSVSRVYANSNGGDGLLFLFIHPQQCDHHQQLFLAK